MPKLTTDDVKKYSKEYKRHVLTRLLRGMDYCYLRSQYGEDHPEVKAFQEKNPSWETDAELFGAWLCRDDKDSRKRFLRKLDEIMIDYGRDERGRLVIP